MYGASYCLYIKACLNLLKYYQILRKGEKEKVEKKIVHVVSIPSFLTVFP